MIQFKEETKVYNHRIQLNNMYANNSYNDQVSNSENGISPGRNCTIRKLKALR